MARIKKLKLKLESGLLTELQSDTIFGHFAWRLKDKFGEEKLEEFLELYSSAPVFTLSGGFTEKEDIIFFPKPLRLTPAGVKGKSKKEKVKNFLLQKESKSRTLITNDELNLFINGKKEEFEKSLASEKDVKFPALRKELRIGVEIDRETLKSKDGRLFPLNPVYPDNSTFFVIFVKILDESNWESYYCEEILKDVFRLGYGKKKSSGFGEFKIKSFDEYNGFDEPENSNGFISLSHYLPSDSDCIKEQWYDYNLKYGKFGEEMANGKNPFKPGMLFLKPGSCFVTDVKRDYYGRMIKVSDYIPKALQCGVAFTLKVKYSL